MNSQGGGRWREEGRTARARWEGQEGMQTARYVSRQVGSKERGGRKGQKRTRTRRKEVGKRKERLFLILNFILSQGNSMRK